MKFKFRSLLLNKPDQPPPQQEQNDPPKVNSFDALTYYKDLYEKEIELADRLNNKTANSLTILTILGSGHVLLFSDIYSLVSPFTDIWIIVTLLCLASGLLFIKAMCCFWKAYRGFGYTYYPIKDMVESVNAVTLNRALEEDLKKSMTDLYKSGATTNRDINRDKIEKQYELGGAMAWSFVALLALFVLWFVILKPLLPLP